MKMDFMLSLLTLGIALPSAFAYPGGAPSTVCSSMTPSHYGSSPQATPPPFSVTTSSGFYTGGSKITVNLNAPCGNRFKGFMLQARRTGSDQALGSFNTPSGSKIVTCGSSQAVTHTERTVKSSMSFEWTAPVQSSGHVVFTATFVEHFATYWVKVNSAVVFDSNAPVGANSSGEPSPLACSTTKPPPMRTTTRMANKSTTTTAMWENPATWPSVKPDMMCGVSKGCFSDCRSTKCSYLVSWEYQSQYNEILFEIQANMMGGDNRWMAIGFSDDKKMGNDSVVECVSFQGKINVYSSFNQPYHHSNTRLSNMYLGVTKVSGSFVNGIFKCSFRRAIPSLAPGFLDLFESRFLFVATGKTQSFSDEKMKHDEVPLSTDSKFDAFSMTIMRPPVAVGCGKALTTGMLPILLLAFMCTMVRFFM